MAVLGTLMGTQPTQQVGALLMKDLDDRASTEKANRRKYLGNGFIMEPDGSVTRDEGMAAAEVEKQKAIIDRMYTQNDLIVGRPQRGFADTPEGKTPFSNDPRTGETTTGQPVPNTAPRDNPPPVPPSQMSEAESWNKLDSQIGQLGADVRRSPGVTNKTNALLVATAGLAPEAFRPLAETWAKENVYTPEELKVVQSLDFGFQQFLSELSGKASTAQELQNVQRWTAMRGQGLDPMLNALTQMQKFARDKSQSLGNPYNKPAAPQQPQGGGKVGTFNPATGKVEYR
jgi:hypothetical protein